MKRRPIRREQELAKLIQAQAEDRAARFRIGDEMFVSPRRLFWVHDRQRTGRDWAPLVGATDQRGASTDRKVRGSAPSS